MISKEVLFPMKKYLALPLALCFFLPLSASAYTPAGTAQIIHSSAETGQLYFSTASEGDMNFSSASTMYFNDETGALLAFTVNADGHTMHASIRKNGMLIWEESFPDTTQKYSITRKTDSISPYFLMNLGNRTYVARYDKDGKMDVQELRTDVRKSDIRPEA